LKLDDVAASTDIRVAPSASRNFVVPALNLKNLALIGVVAIIYFVAGKLGLYFAAYNPSSSPVWPAAGIAIAALLLGGFRFWPAVFLGAFFVNVTTSGSSLTSLEIATGNTLEALVGAYSVNTRSKVHQRAEAKIRQLERGDGLMVLLLAGGARGGSPPRCCCEELIS